MTLRARIERLEGAAAGVAVGLVQFHDMPDEVRLAWLCGAATDDQRRRWPAAWELHRVMWSELLRTPAAETAEP